MNISMEGYIQNKLLKLQQPPPQNTKYTPLKLHPEQYEAKMKFAKEEYVTPELSVAAIQLLQQNIGDLLFDERYVEMKLMVALSNLLYAQDHGKEAMARAMLQLLNYCAPHTDTIIRHNQSGTILKIHSDASYLYEKK